VSLDIVQFGCGRWGAHVLRDLRSLGARVTVVARGEESVRRAREGGAARILRRFAEVERADGVVVVTPSRHHAEAIRAAAALGCPIFCEKPLVTDAVVERELTELCGERLFVMHKWRWHPGIEAIARLAQDGAVGDVQSVRSARLDWGSFHPDVDAFDTALAHDLSIGIAILGAIPAVAAVRATPDPRIPGGWAEATVLFAGAVGPRLAVEVSTVSASPLRRVEAHGALGSAVLAEPEADAVELLVHGGDLEAPPARERVVVEREWPLLRELRDFVAHCGGGPPPRADAAEGFAVVRAIAAVRQALAAGP
jgi:predicted dehydrogenase